VLDESLELLRTPPGESARPQLQLVQPERAQSLQILRFITCGSVDDGKSTLIGRMLKDLGLVPQDTWEHVPAESERRSFSRDRPDYSLISNGASARKASPRKSSLVAQRRNSSPFRSPAPRVGKGLHGDQRHPTRV
jgi:hypothetical protein